MLCRCTISLYTRPRSHNFMKDTTSHVKKTTTVKTVTNVKRKGVTMSLALERRAETDSATYTPTMLLQAVVMVRSEGTMR